MPQARRRSLLPFLALAAGLVVAFGGIAAARPDGWTRVTVLDVGQGDAILIEGSSGGRVLVDGGPDPDRLRALLDARVPAWDRRLDVVILTHPHEDHVAGLVGLLGRYRIGRFYEPGMAGPGPSYIALAGLLDKQGQARGRLATGDRFTVDDGRFRVLWPDPGSVPRSPPDNGKAINNVSIVLELTVGRRSFLLMGDAEQEIDPILLARGLRHNDVLKVAHHGSETATTEPFLAAVRPGLAIVSVGAKNRYGHPSRGAIGRLEAASGHVLRTDQDGSVTVTTDGRAVRVTGGGTDRAGAGGEVGLAGRPAVVGAPAPGAPRGRIGARLERASQDGRLARVRARPSRVRSPRSPRGPDRRASRHTWRGRRSPSGHRRSVRQSDRRPRRPRRSPGSRAPR